MVQRLDRPPAAVELSPKIAKRIDICGWGYTPDEIAKYLEQVKALPGLTSVELRGNANHRHIRAVPEDVSLTTRAVMEAIGFKRKLRPGLSRASAQSAK
jgi:hypothetical protein